MYFVAFCVSIFCFFIVVVSSIQNSIMDRKLSAYWKEQLRIIKKSQNRNHAIVQNKSWLKETNYGSLDVSDFVVKDFSTGKLVIKK